MRVEHDKVAIVTGASQGIGKATAIRLGRDFGAVAIVARSADKLADTARRLEQDGVKVLSLAVDLRAPDAADVVVGRTLDVFGRVDAVVNIAGDVAQVDLFEMTEAQWDAGMALKFHAARKLTLRAWDALQRSNGSVVFMSGNSALAPKAAFAAVASINAAIVALAKAFAERGQQAGVAVNSVLPGAVMTGRRLAFLDKWAEAHGVSRQHAKADFLASAGIVRYGEPEEIAELVALLVSPGGKWMTGSALRIDGGELRSA